MTDLDQVAARRRTMHEQRVRAERAERELRRTERILARLYEVRRTIRETP